MSSLNRSYTKKQIENRAKTSLKNRLVFSRKLFNDTHFREQLATIIKEYGEQSKASEITLNTIRGTNYDPVNALTLHKESYSIVKNFSSNKKISFVNSVNNFIDEFSFGKEWFYPVITLVIKGILCPPWENFNMEKRGLDGRKRVVLVLNPDTSLEDIEAFFSMIKEKQKKLWPNFKKVNLTKKTFEAFNTAFQNEMMTIIKADKENLDRLSQYEETKYSMNDLESSQKAINAYRTKSRQTGINKKAKPIKLKQRVPYKKIVKNGVKKSEQNRNYNKLAQQRKRQKFDNF